VGWHSIMMSVSVYMHVCLSVCRVYPELHLNYISYLHHFFLHVAYDHGSVLLCQHCDMLCTSGIMDDIMFAHNIAACIAT